MDKFKVGQKVRYKGLVRQSQDNGKVVTVEGPKTLYQNSFGEFYVGYPMSDGYGAEEKNLEPIYDGDEKSSWNECEWKPKDMSAEDLVRYTRPQTDLEKALYEELKYYYEQGELIEEYEVEEMENKAEIDNLLQKVSDLESEIVELNELLSTQ